MPSQKHPGLNRRTTSALHYQTFPVRPPKFRSRPPSTSSSNEDGRPFGHHGSSLSGAHHASPLPKKQLAVLAVIALAEQTALNSMSPYLPEMASTFPEVDPSQVGLYVGLIASAFALAQFATGFLWGWLSDHIGRKPVILLGTLLTAACMFAFGFCRTLWQAVLVQALMGLFNGNQGVVPTCLGEITDKSNQSEAFTYLPVLYGLGAITGPMVGGLLVSRRDPTSHRPLSRYPHLPPNLFSAAVLLIDFAVSAFLLEESLEEAKSMPPLSQRISGLFSRLRRVSSSKKREHGHQHDHGQSGLLDGDYHGAESDAREGSDHQSLASLPELFGHQSAGLKSKHVLNRDTILILASYLIFQLSNVTFFSLYPIFASSPPPTGRDLTPRVIGLSLAFAGIATILFQVGIFGRMRVAFGNRATYRMSHAAFTIAFMLMPWVGYQDTAGPSGLGQGRVWLWLEIGFVLLVKTIASVAGLTSALLLVGDCVLHSDDSLSRDRIRAITNSAPNHSVLGTLNGIAQTLSAAGRAIGPFLSGGLFSISTHVKPKGELLAWGVFGGVAFVGFLMSFGIKSPQLEAEGWEEEDGPVHSDNEDDDHDGTGYDDAHETDGLLSTERNGTK
ncbi:MAG: hypothetical protein M1816_008049 [Peltula sp. TS41687]|nr:MAG: hypothetical protein M1816_008049 [Peltula sp. TS41687]